MVPALLMVLGGCGDGASSSDTRGNSAGSSGAASGGMGMGGGGASATAGTSSAGVGSGGSAMGRSCSGAVGPAAAVFTEAVGVRLGGVGLTGDELEVYYVQRLGDAPPGVVRRKRASKDAPFGGVETLPELADACRPDQHVNQDVTDDGLALYVTCTDMVDIGLPEGVSTLRVARRPDRASAFTLQTEPAGGVLASAGISADELTAYTDGEIYNTAPRMFTRATKAESFGGEAQPIPGIDVPFNSPDISNDGLVLFGAARAASGNGNAIFRALRDDASGAFAVPLELDLQLPAGTIGAPNITPSCTLYVVLAPLDGGNSVYAAALE